MRKFSIQLVIALLLGIAAFGWLQIVEGQGPIGPDGRRIVKRETQEKSAREISAPQNSAPQQPSIGFIDSPSATCYQPDSAQDVCYLNWYYMAVDANPNYMITMTVKINSIGFVSQVHGFFQTSMYVPYNMYGPGYKVACGALGAGGNPTLGNAYSYEIRARDSANLGSANYGTTYCPARKP
ncbi:MAG: hypothetical protein HZC40_19065 [Chloroflexi bacterium]|nr:hypothetical protein [Chloroflexota bacterium]